jgi:hypothetical protein
MAGKNHVSRSFRLYFDDSGATARDLSGDLVPGSCQGGGLVYDQVEMTGESNSVKNYLANHPDSEVTATFIVNDTATTGAFTVLKGMMGAGGTLTLQWGQNGAAPTTGDPKWEGEYVCFGGPMSFDGGKAVWQITFKPQAGQSAPAFGTV